MPRYFIDAAVGSLRDRDDDGVVALDDTSAHEIAVATLHDLARIATAEGREAPLSVVVRTETGERLCTVSMTISTEWSRARGSAAGRVLEQVA
ncbi:DUF6894 family protein [Methylobacterium oxalidis]|uniref:DUF6894 domain-containing protein n=1 Tax=Methylobacterium oxalidis TaxID=944322 RepID=A0A512IXL8_9HYPH|nr:hypothetical protein [Methylobacterium oxalidis]GEP02478.1 hypothetical protein MOX02_05160 [Methylobacterium oxalidis]GJE31992.1 hypothetical protein LDDCCGHA_2174 [Methylobacterium oxalidis]GLS67857.1 hypothetical protein GCM10007888_62420 [Methylobacterium oxalidis]